MITFFSKFWKSPEQTVTLEQIKQIIASDKLKLQTDKIHQSLLDNGGNKSDEFESLKKQLPCVIFAGEFSERNNKSLGKYSGHIVIDIDGLDSAEHARELGQKLKEQTDVVLLFISPSGRGLKVVHQLKLDDSMAIADFHKLAFKCLEEKYKKEFNVEIDNSGKDLARLCFLCHDPQVYYNENAGYFQVEPLATKKTVDAAPKTGTVQECSSKSNKADDLTHFILDDILSYLRKNDLSITNEYHKWMKVGFALKTELGDVEGREYFHKFSKMDNNYDVNKTDQQFDKGANNCQHRVGMGTIIFMAKQVNYKYPKLDKMKKSFFECQEARGILEADGISIRYNTFKTYREIKYPNKDWKRFEDLDLYYIYITVLNRIFKKGDCDDWLYTVAVDSSYDPFKALIDGFPEYDGKDYIGQLAGTIKSKDQDKTYLFLKRWLIGVIASVDKKEVYSENVLVLIGKQSIGKTRWVKTLLPDGWKEYISTKNLDPNNKDDLLMLSQYAIVLMDELSTILNRKASTEAFKAMTSLDKVTVRKAYGREITEYPRCASIIGTSNEDEFLKDFTGNRRFFSIHAEAIDADHNVDIMKVLGHAYHLYKNGEPWYLSDSEVDLVNEHNVQFEATDMYKELIMKYCGHSGDDGYYTCTDLIDKINYATKDMDGKGTNPLNHSYAQQMGRALKSLGFEQVTKKVLGKSKRLYKLTFDPNGFDHDKGIEETNTSPILE